jgi:hypothetical protein
MCQEFFREGDGVSGNFFKFRKTTSRKRKEKIFVLTGLILFFKKNQ